MTFDKLKIKLSLLFIQLKRSSLFKDSFWALLGSVIGKGLSLIAGIAVARFLGKELYGEYGTIKTTLTYIAIVSTFGFGYTATKYIAEYIQEQSDKVHSLVKNIYKITLVFSSVLALFLWVFASQIAEFIDAPHLNDALRISSIVVIANALTTTQIGILSGFKSFKAIAKNNTYSGIVIFVTSIAFTYLWGFEGAVYSLLVSFVFQVFLNELSMRRILRKYVCEKTIGKCEIKNMIAFSMPIALQESLYTVVHWLSVLLLIKYANYGEVGISSAASLWQSLVIFVPSVLKNVMFSHLTSALEHKKLVNKLLLINFCSSIIPVAIVLIFSNFICSFYGDNFTGLHPVLIVSVSSSVLICLSEVYCYEFISIGKPWFVFGARFIRDSFILCLGYIIIPQFSMDQAFIFSIILFFMNLAFLCIMYFVNRRKNNNNLLSVNIQ